MVPNLYAGLSRYDLFKPIILCKGVIEKNVLLVSALWSQWLKKWIAPSTEAGAEALVHNRPFWRLVESLPSFKTALLANVYIGWSYHSHFP